MKILTINYEYPPLGGGGGVAAAALAEEFVRQGHEVDYITTHFCGQARKEIIKGVNLWREPVLNRKELATATIESMLTYPPMAIKRGLACAKTKKYDIVHTHFAIPSGPAGIFLARRMRVPHVLSVLGGDLYDPSKRYSPHRHPVLGAVVKRVLRNSAYVIAESDDIAARAANIYGVAKPLIIPLGFVPPLFAKKNRQDMGLDEEMQYAIAVSRLIPRKAYGDLLTAFAQVRIAKLKLLIIGDGPEETMLRGLAKQLGIEERVQFLGYQSEENKYGYLACSDFFVLASLHEGFGIVFQEAMQCGLPIAATNVGGQNDFLSHGLNALLTAPGDTAALASSIYKLSIDAQLRKMFGEESRKVLGQFHIDTIARRHLELFQSLADKRRHEYV